MLGRQLMALLILVVSLQHQNQAQSLFARHAKKQIVHVDQSFPALAVNCTVCASYNQLIPSLGWVWPRPDASCI